MTELPPAKPAEDKDGNAVTKIVRIIATGLQGNPEYLLIFGIIALFVVLFYVGIALDKIKADASLHTLLITLFVVSVIGMIAVVYIRERKAWLIAKRETAQPTATALLQHDFSREVGDIDEALRNASAFDHPVFKDAAERIVSGLRKTAQDLGRGMFADSETDADVTLPRIYKEATSTIFATSVPEYLSVWQSPFGRNLLDIHEHGDAHVTRVFIFNTRDEVTEETMDELVRHAAIDKVTLYVFVDDDAKSYYYPAELSKDFTIVDDGKVLGVTLSYGDRSRAQWYFNDQDRTRRYEGVRDQLISHSYKFAKFKELWDSDQEKRKSES